MNASSAPTFDALGHSGLRVSRLWLGTMTFGSRTDEAQARSIVDATRDSSLFVYYGSRSSQPARARALIDLAVARLPDNPAYVLGAKELAALEGKGRKAGKRR